MTKKICITGATGLIGKLLTKSLKESGYSVLAFSRNPSKATKQLQDADEYARWDDKDLESIRLAIESSYAIVNLAGASITGKRWDEEYKKEIYDSRINGTRALAEAIKSANEKPKVFISTSAVGYYGDTGSQVIDEEQAPTDNFLAKTCIDWEKEAQIVEDITRVVLPRIGIVLSSEGGALKEMLPAFRYFVGGPIGSGKQYFPWIHIEDVVGIIKFALENDNIKGAINTTAPNPVTMSEFASKLGNTINKPSLFKVPKFVARIVLGESADFILGGTNAIPKKLIDNNFKFKFEYVDSALRNLLLNK